MQYILYNNFLKLNKLSWISSMSIYIDLPSSILWILHGLFNYIFLMNMYIIFTFSLLWIVPQETFLYGCPCQFVFLWIAYSCSSLLTSSLLLVSASKFPMLDKESVIFSFRNAHSFFPLTLTQVPSLQNKVLQFYVCCDFHLLWSNKPLKYKNLPCSIFYYFLIF